MVICVILKQKTALQPKQLQASSSNTKPLFSSSQVALLRMSNKIDDLVQTTNSLKNTQGRARSTSPLVSREVPKTHFRQHIFNNIFKEKCQRAFTADAVLNHPFEHFVKELPTEVHGIIGK